jgi:hypothetical protein
MYQFGMIAGMTMKINNSLIALTVAGFMISNISAYAGFGDPSPNARGTGGIYDSASQSPAKSILAMGGGAGANGPDAYIGIVGAHPAYQYSTGDTYPAYGYPASPTDDQRYTYHHHIVRHYGNY